MGRVVCRPHVGEVPHVDRQIRLSGRRDHRVRQGLCEAGPQGQVRVVETRHEAGRQILAAVAADHTRLPVGHTPHEAESRQAALLVEAHQDVLVGLPTVQPLYLNRDSWDKRSVLDFSFQTLGRIWNID